MFGYYKFIKLTMENSLSPEQLKAQLKELIKQSKLKEATQIADKSIDSFQNLQLQ